MGLASLDMDVASLSLNDLERIWVEKTLNLNPNYFFRSEPKFVRF